MRPILRCYLDYSLRRYKEAGWRIAATLLLSPISTMLMVVALNMAISSKRPRRASLKGSLCCRVSNCRVVDHTKIAANMAQVTCLPVPLHVSRFPTQDHSSTPIPSLPPRFPIEGCGHSESPRMGLNRTKIANNAELLDLQRRGADSFRENHYLTAPG